MKGRIKLERKNGIYYVFVKDYFWQRWKPLINCGEQVAVKSMEEFGKATKIECFDRIIISRFDLFSASNLDL